MALSINYGEMKRGVEDCLYSQLFESITHNIPTMQKEIQQIVFNTIDSDSTFLELRTPGYLSSLLGLTTEAQNGVNAIIKAFAEQTEIAHTLTKNPLTLKLTVGVIESNYNKLFLMDEAYTQINNDKTNSSFTWLKMFLQPFEISGWSFTPQINRYEAKFISRSKNGLMKHNGMFVLPSQYTNTMDHILKEISAKLPNTLSNIYK